ncbi:hypothetical protein [Amycolatopsis sp. NPDC098790]|uniref:hypothetical protein n=1 Tax=Amycolatopsis sp. NPDC098790 TaxID=3363939 RepID=UPI0037F6415B
MTLLTVVDVVLLIAVLAAGLYAAGTLLGRIAANLEDCAEQVREITGHAELIVPGVEHINRTGGVVAGALPLLYGMAEEVVAGAVYQPPAEERAPARPASGTRRSRLHEMVGFTPR